MTSDKYTEAMGKRGAAILRKSKRGKRVAENAALAGKTCGCEQGRCQPDNCGCNCHVVMIDAKEARKDWASATRHMAGEPEPCGKCDLCVNGHQGCYSPVPSKSPQDARRGPLPRRRAPRAPKKARKAKSPSLSKLKKLLWEEIRHVVYYQSPEACLSCGENLPPVACHIVPSGDGAVIRFFLPAIYRGCRNCNDDERRHRGRWRGKFEEIFGKDYVDALYAMSEDENKKGPAEKFQLKKHWVLEQTERMRRLRAVV